MIYALNRRENIFIFANVVTLQIILRKETLGNTCSKLQVPKIKYGSFLSYKEILKSSISKTNLVCSSTNLFSIQYVKTWCEIGDLEILKLRVIVMIDMWNFFH